jgi:hypothetical protein
MQEEHTQKKVPSKNILYFRKYKKDKFLIYYFLYTLLMYISIYIFNDIIFGDIEVWNFKILKVKGARVPMCTKSLLPTTC